MRETKLKAYFPMLKTREELMEIISKNGALTQTFNSWKEERQEEFLDFCSGARGVKMLYDAFAKELLSPKRYPERLNEIISLLLGTAATIIEILPTEGVRLAAEESLLTMDVVVKLADGTICNVEIQKIGYAFPGQRSACYSADLLLRQYRAIRESKVKAEDFSYREIKTVYSIIFFEHSPREFHHASDHIIHRYEQQGDTGVKLELLQKYIFITLDNFLKLKQNKDISDRLNAWFLFLGSDDPEDVIRLIEIHPDFKAMYRQIYEICENVENVMGLFSEELAILDRNTVKYMMDEMQEEIDQKKAELEQHKAELEQHKAEIDQQKAEIDHQKAEIDHQKAEIDHQKAEIDHQKAEIDHQKTEIDHQKNLLAEKDTLLAQVLAENEKLREALASGKIQV